MSIKTTAYLYFTKRIFLIMGILWGLSLTITGQFFGNPTITHYSHTDFNSDAQFWDATQDSSGVMYFGNNYGILLFDGERWDKISLPNSSAVRSLHYSKDGNIYAGGYNDFGIVRKDKKGTPYFQSLRHVLPPQICRNRKCLANKRT